MKPKLSVVVPVHNEAGFVQTGLNQIQEILASLSVSSELLVVENGSTDNTFALAQEALGQFPGQVISLPEPDYGEGMRAGFLTAQGEVVVNFDIDYFSQSFLEQVLSDPDDFDVVIGSKRDARSQDERSGWRKLATRVFNLLLRILFSSRVSDTHGIKAFRAESVLPLVPLVEARKDLFDTELVLRAERAGLRIREVPVIVTELRASRSSLLRRVPRTLRGLWQLRRRLRRPG